MSNKQQRNLLGGLARLASELNPVSSFTFLCALGITAFAAWDWLEESGEPRPRFPWYGAMAVSYAGGFLIGRVFWKVLKTAAIVAAIVLGGLALLNRVDVDTSKAKAAAEADSAWVQKQASLVKHFLVHLLPSSLAAGVGAFTGGWRRGGDLDKDPAAKKNGET
jgi:hypothetical protein